jgi:L-histidine N-alpha-methyltransferase
VSAEFLDASAAQMRAELPWLSVEPVMGDFTEEIEPPAGVEGPVLFAFLGSTIGNLDTAAAIALLRTVRRAMRPGDRFLLGADLRTKPVARIERAYNDAEGVTAEFNRNMLRVLNTELCADFDPSRFEHHAFWSWGHHRVEMHLVAREEHRVWIPRLGAVWLRQGETIRTEICCKYDRGQLETMLASAGLRIETWRVDPHDQYAILLATIAGDHA